MNTVAGIGVDSTLEGFALAGVRILAAETESDIVTAWESLDDTVSLVILTPEAARVLATELDRQPDRLTVVMP